MISHEVSSVPTQEFSRGESNKYAKRLLKKGFAILSQVPEAKQFLNAQTRMPSAVPQRNPEDVAKLLGNLLYPRMEHKCDFNLGESSYSLAHYAGQSANLSLVRHSRETVYRMEAMSIKAVDKGSLEEPEIKHMYLLPDGGIAYNNQMAVELIVKVFEQMRKDLTPKKSPEKA